MTTENPQPMTAAALYELLGVHHRAGRVESEEYEDLGRLMSDLDGKTGRLARDRESVATWEATVLEQQGRVLAGTLPVGVLRESVACLRNALARAGRMEAEHRHMVMALWDALARALGRLTRVA